MYLMPAPVLPSQASARAQMAADRARRRRGVSLSGLACHCRGGHYMDGLADDGVAIDPTAISTTLIPPPDAPYVNPLPVVLVPDTSGSIQPTPGGISTTLVAPAAGGVQTSAPGGGAYVARAAAPVMPAGSGPKQPFLDRQMISGLPNKYLVAGLAGILVLASAGNKRR